MTIFMIIELQKVIHLPKKKKVSKIEEKIWNLILENLDFEMKGVYVVYGMRNDNLLNG